MPKNRQAFPFVLLVSALLMIGCGRIAQPDGWAAPAVHDDVVFTSHDTGKLGAFRLSGGRIWEFPGEKSPLKLTGLYGNPVVRDDTVYITAYDGSVAAIAIADGSQRWHRTIGGRVVGGALVTDDSVYAGNDAGEVVALNRANGNERWRTKVGNEVWATPVTDGSAIFVAAMDGTVGAFNPDGSRRWQRRIAEAGIAGTPVLQDGVLYFGSFDKRLYAVDAATGTTLWRSEPAENWFWTEPLIDGDNLYAGNMDGHVYAVDKATGALRWRTDVGAPVRGRTAIAHGVLLIPTKDGRLWGLRPQDGEQAWPPVEVGGQLYADLVVVRGDVLLASEVGKKSHKLYRVDATRGDVSEIPLTS
jgi:outer membrane protein assembly factor BamB